jgi:hypothetical protein
MLTKDVFLSKRCEYEEFDYPFGTSTFPKRRFEHQSYILRFPYVTEESAIVGDYGMGDNSSLQLRNISSVIYGPGDLRVTKIEPVTLSGFVPAVISTEPDKPTPSQRITVVGYGANSTWEFIYDVHSFPGQALQTSLEVLADEFCKEGFSDRSFNGSNRFCAASVNNAGGLYPFDDTGPCSGECCC